MTIEWKDVYKIGNPEIDAQHQEIFGFANKFLAATGKVELTACAVSVYKHTREHFQHEENLMRSVQYPAMEIHVQQHNELISRLNEVAASIANDTLNMKDLESFLSDWLRGHIRMYDSKLAGYVKIHSR